MPTSSFWLDRNPCWEVLDCPEEVSSRCAARLDPARPCWEHPETQCHKVLPLPVECRHCKVFKLYAT